MGPRLIERELERGELVLASLTVEGRDDSMFCFEHDFTYAKDSKRNRQTSSV